MTVKGGSEASVSEERAAHILDAAPAAVVVVDAHGTITWVGGALEVLTGFRPDDVLGTSMLDHIDIEWNPMALDSVLYAMEHPGVRRPMLFRLKRRDGSVFVAEVTANSQLDNPAVQGLVAYVRRVDSAYLMDQVLEQLARDAPIEDIFELLTQVMGAEILEADGAILFDRVDDAFSQVVAAPAIPFDLPPHIEGSDWETCLSDQSATSQPVGQLTDALATPAAAADYRGLWCWPVVVAGDAVGVVTLWRHDDEEPDYTCRMTMGSIVQVVQLVLEREAIRRRARSQEVLASLGTLTAGVAAEIQQPLAFVATFTATGMETLADLSERAGGADDDTKELLEDLRESLDLVAKHTERMDAIVSGMLGYSKGHSSDPKDVDLGHLVRTFADLGYQGYRAAGHEDFTANFVVHGTEGALAEVFPDQLARVIVNLVTNACAAAQRSGEDPAKARPEVFVDVSFTDEVCTVTVRDNGPAIPENELDGLFHPAAQAASSAGTGIGLATCREIVVGLHRGTLTVDSGDRGTTFTATVPRRLVYRPASVTEGDRLR
jgi:PAS domain S-box-containing protein